VKVELINLQTCVIELISYCIKHMCIHAQCYVTIEWTVYALNMWG
jgi:hypothetical protein